jgi:inosine-uridine nucleoside N-ribohydrolase
LTAAIASSAGGQPAEGAAPARLIFDTDIGNDVDDVLALGVIHSLQSRGMCQLLAVTVTKDHELSASFVDAVNTFFGRGDIPVGAVRGGATPTEGRFLSLARQRDDGKLRYPHNLESGKDAPEAVTLLRRILSAQPDRSVVFVQVGFSTNLARLLSSAPDSFSPLPGRELVKRKGKLLSMMAGAFKTIGDNPRHLEYNVITDIPSAQQVVSQWPAPIVLSGYEIGIAIPYPSESIERDYGYVEHHPLAEAYRLYNPPPHNRPTWDLTSVLYAVLPDRGYFDLSAPGRVTVEADGATRFEQDPAGPHRYLIVSEEQVIRAGATLEPAAVEPGDEVARRRMASGGWRVRRGGLGLLPLATCHLPLVTRKCAQNSSRGPDNVITRFNRNGLQ